MTPDPLLLINQQPRQILATHLTRKCGEAGDPALVPRTDGDRLGVTEFSPSSTPSLVNTCPMLGSASACKGVTAGTSRRANGRRHGPPSREQPVLIPMAFLVYFLFN